MRTQDRTYTNQISFGEKDRNQPEHDDICTYLTQDSKLKKMALMLEGLMDFKFGYFEFSRRYKLSAPLFRPSYNGSKFIAGYADLLFEYSIVYGQDGVEYHDKEVRERKEYFRQNGICRYNEKYCELGINADGEKDYVLREPYKSHNEYERRQGYVLIEVKLNKININKILQQFNTYRELTNEFGWPKQVLATAYGLTDYEKNLLSNSGIKHIYVSMDDVSNFIKKTENEITVNEEF